MKRRRYEYEIACAKSDVERFRILSDRQADRAIEIGSRTATISAQYAAERYAKDADWQAEMARHAASSFARRGTEAR